MANILEFLRVLLTDGDEQQHFGEDPTGYVTSNGFADLSGEDVAEAIRVLVRTLPSETSQRLSPYADDGDLPSIRPQVDETELDAAVRQLRFAVFLSPAPSAADQEPEPASVAQAAEDSSALEPEPPREADAEPVTLNYEIDTPAPALTIPASGALDPYAVFGGEVASIMRHTGEQMNAVLARAESKVEAIVQEAARDAQNTRESAQSEAQAIRDTATQEADVILRDAKSTRDQADATLAQARSSQDDALREAAELVQNAERESTAMQAEARARRDEIRAAEKELRKRLEGVNSVFESLGQSSVVPDES